jgi:hypothetical protein
MVTARRTIGFVQEQAPRMEAATAKTSTAPEQTENAAPQNQQPRRVPIRDGQRLLLRPGGLMQQQSGAGSRSGDNAAVVACVDGRASGRGIVVDLCRLVPRRWRTRLTPNCV